jgi:hypothetical protein
MPRYFNISSSSSSSSNNNNNNNNLLSTEIDFWRRAARTSRILIVRNEVITEKMTVNKYNLERMENNMLKWHGHIKLRMEDNRWPKRKMTWSPEGGRR